MWHSCTSTQPICIHVLWCEWAWRRFLSGSSTFICHAFWKWGEWPLRESLPLKPFRWCWTLLVTPKRSSYTILYYFLNCCPFRKIDMSLTCKMFPALFILFSSSRAEHLRQEFLWVFATFIKAHDLLGFSSKFTDSGVLYLHKLRMQVRACWMEASLCPHFFLMSNREHFLLWSRDVEAISFITLTVQISLFVTNIAILPCGRWH